MRMQKIAALLFCFLCSAIPCTAQDAASARAFMNSAFHLYEHHGHGISGKVQEKRFVHSTLLALIDKDLKVVAAAGSELPYAADYEFICDCQEWDGIWGLRLDVKIENPQLAHAVASFKLFDPKTDPKTASRTMQYTLVPEDGQWKIYDLKMLSPAPAPGESSLREGLVDEIASYEHPQKH